MRRTTVTGFFAAATIALSTQGASAAAMMGDCTTKIINVPTQTQPVGGYIADCGACVSVDVSGCFNFDGVLTPGGVGISFGWQVCLTVGTSICAGPCESCGFGATIRGAKVLEKTCWKNPWLPWNSRYKVVTYKTINPGKISVTKICESSNDTSCNCRSNGHDCPCTVDPPVLEISIEYHERNAKNPSDVVGTGRGQYVTSMMIDQIRTTDISGRSVQSLKAMSRHDLAVLDAIFPEDGTIDRPTLLLIFDNGNIEEFDAATLHETIDSIDAGLVNSGSYLDVDGNDVVDQGDVQAVLESMNALGGMGRPFNHFADVNADGRVDEADLLLVSGAI